MYKLFQINTTYNWGSTGRIAEEIGQTVIQKGWESYIAYGRYINKGKSHAIRIGNQLDIYNHVFQTRLFDRHGLSSKQATKKLIENIKIIQPDIIHLHNIHGYYVNYPILFNYLSIINTPIVWTLHDCWPFTGHCAYYTFSKCERWKNGCYQCPQKNSYPATLFMDNSRANYENKRKHFTSLKNLTLIPVSKWLENEVKQSFFKNTRIKVINNGIDISVFTPSISQKPIYEFENKFVILGVASIWEERKGLNDFIKLSYILPSKFKIILVGLTLNQIKSLPSSIIGITRTNNTHELAQLYATADVFINPTWEDNFPTTNLEALACGTPIITYNTGGSIEAIDNETGYIVDTGNIQMLVDKIITLSKIKDKISLKNKCRQRAIEFFNKKDRYEEYYQLYLNLINTLK